MGTGYLRIETRTNNDTIAISRARVRITNITGKILAELTTDQNGQTEFVPLETVGRDLTLDPGYTGAPYSTYNILVNADGFENIIIYGVQILDGLHSHQPVTMIPMRQGQGKPDTFGIVLEDHALVLRSPRRQGQETMPEPQRLVAIPEEITIHMGAPSSQATNITVNFTDYIKSVACSEIYATWPQAAIVANILAQITFALNRIMTEWYRSQGYDFDITSTSAYDQHYVYGQTIHDNISRIVDCIFNQYISRPSQFFPYVISNCDSTKAICSGLSRWGTVALANSGMDALAILRHYYPGKIEIAQTNIIANIIEIYPGTALCEGSTGPDVQVIQHKLNRIRLNYPDIPLIKNENGVFGSDTTASVTAFQNAFNLMSDGLVGKATWYRIAFIFAAETKLSNMDSEGTMLEITEDHPEEYLSMGSTGVNVIILQYILNFISEFYPSIPEVKQDGIFEEKTNESVIAFQQLVNLTQDGIVGAVTWEALYDTYWGIKNNVNISPVGEKVREYTVQAGDTLSAIAQRFGADVDAIIALNGLTNDWVYTGQVLMIPISQTEVPRFPYVVQEGESLSSLADRFGTTVQEIVNMNGFASDLVYSGQELTIPANENPRFSYVVQAGDTLSGLAYRFGTSVQEIVKLNCLTEDFLYIGQELKIPGIKPSECS